MGAIFANYHAFPTKAQVHIFHFHLLCHVVINNLKHSNIIFSQLLISEFLSLNDNDAELEQNKELILAL